MNTKKNSIDSFFFSKKTEITRIEAFRFQKGYSKKKNSCRGKPLSVKLFLAGLNKNF